MHRRLDGERFYNRPVHFVYIVRCADGTLDPEGRYDGLNIAIYNQEIVGADRDYMRLQRDLSRKLGVHPERVLVRYLGEWF